jgi:hypothetical protein
MMNATLRTQGSAVEPWRNYMWLLLNALRKLPRFEGETVYRGVTMGWHELGRNYRKGSEFQLAGFSSTSDRVGTTQAFLGTDGPRTLFHLHLTEPLARDIRSCSMHPDESEVLLPPNVKFVVQDILDAGHGFHILQCKQVKTCDVLLDFS